MCVVSVTVFEIMKFNSHKKILGCQKKKKKPWSKFQNFCFYNVYYRFVIDKRWYNVLFYIHRKNLHFVGGVEKNFNDLVQNAKKVHTCIGLVHKTLLFRNSLNFE